VNGRVTANHAVLDIGLRFQHRPDFAVGFVVDTEFVGFLTLPPAAIAALRLPFLRRIAANLADDSTIHVSVHAATIIWDGEDREVEVLATGSRPLLGTLLLDGHGLTVRFTEGSMVAVESL
jgi:clan AA aspartic protease